VKLEGGKNDENIIIAEMRKSLKDNPKLRTALFQGGEDDEPIAPQDVHGDMSSDNSNIAASNSLISFGLKFGIVIFNEKYITNTKKFTAVGVLSMINFKDTIFNKE